MKFTCSTTGIEIGWSSNPPLGENGQARIHGFTHASPIKEYVAYIIYLNDSQGPNGTAFFISAVLEDDGPEQCKSSLTLSPIPDVNGNFPAMNDQTFTINCTAGMNNVQSTESQQLRVAGMMAIMPWCAIDE